MAHSLKSAARSLDFAYSSVPDGRLLWAAQEVSCSSMGRYSAFSEPQLPEASLGRKLPNAGHERRNSTLCSELVLKAGARYPM